MGSHVVLFNIRPLHLVHQRLHILPAIIEINLLVPLYEFIDLLLQVDPEHHPDLLRDLLQDFVFLYLGAFDVLDELHVIVLLLLHYHFGLPFFQERGIQLQNLFLKLFNPQLVLLIKPLIRLHLNLKLNALLNLLYLLRQHNLQLLLLLNEGGVVLCIF